MTELTTPKEQYLSFTSGLCKNMTGIQASRKGYLGHNPGYEKTISNIFQIISNLIFPTLLINFTNSHILPLRRNSTHTDNQIILTRILHVAATPHLLHHPNHGFRNEIL